MLSVNARYPERGTSPGVLSTAWKYSMISTCIVSTLAPSPSSTIHLFSYDYTVTYGSFQGHLFVFDLWNLPEKSSQNPALG